MDEYVQKLTVSLNGQRNYTKAIFKIIGTIYRGVNNNRFTLEQALNMLGGAN